MCEIGPSLKISKIPNIPSVRILLFLLEKGEARHSDLAKLFTSRGTLKFSLKDLEDEQLVQRKIVDSKPIQSIYSLTEKGKVAAKQLNDLACSLY